MSNYSNAQQISQKVLTGYTTYSDLLGPRAPQKARLYNGVEPGLNLDTTALDQQREKLQEGVFQVLFTGGFSSGKSTLLNALMRRSILRMNINPETAIITKILFEKDEKVIVYYKDVDSATGKPITKSMPLNAFFDNFRVDQEDADKFKVIDYAVLQMGQPGIGGSMVQLVDSPGTQNSDADTKAARSFARSADAIVYLVNATQPFIQEEKEYIATHYANKHMENLFFVINRFDSVAEDQVPDLKRGVREQLSKVFTRADGSFNEELFNSRVFYTNAYGALMARTGQKVKVMGMEVAIPEESTGVPQFEAALARFLTDDGRDRKAFQAYLPRLAGMYVSAEEAIQQTLKIYQEGEDTLRAKKLQVEASRDEYQDVEQQILESCRAAVAGILMDASSEYSRCVNGINNGWDAHFQIAPVDLRFRDMMGMAFDKVASIFSQDEAAKELKMQKRLQPLANAVNGYIEPKLKEIGPRLEGAIHTRLKQLESQLELCTKRLQNIDSPISVGDIAKKLMEAYHMDTNMIGGAHVNANLFQIILGAIALDPEMIGKGVAGNTSNTSAIITTIIKSILEFVAWYVVAWPIGLGMLAARLVQMIREGRATRNSTAQQILSQMRESTIATLRQNEKNFTMELQNNLSVITRGGATIADAIEKQVQGYVAQINGAITELTQNAHARATEERRTSAIQAQLLTTLQELYQLLNGRILTVDQIKTLAVTK